MFEDRPFTESILFKIIALVLAAALLAGAFLFFNCRAVNATREQMQAEIECEQAVAPLKKQRGELLEKIEDLEIQLAGGDLSYASVLILYVQPNDGLINDALPIVEGTDEFEGYGYPCLVCCEEGSFPGDTNCISVSQALELIDLGWEFGLSLTPEDDVAALCDEMTGRGLPLPTFAYYPLSNFNADDPASEETLFAHGITTVLQYNFVPEDNDEHILRYIAAYGFRERNCRSVLQETIANSNTLTFTIGNNAYELYEKRPFVSMLSLFQNSVEEEHLAVTTIEQALARQDEYKRIMTAREPDLTAQKAEYKQQLAEIEEEITRIYHQYISK